MSLDYITMGQGFEVIFFWSFGAFILGIGAIDTLYKIRKYTDV